MPSEKILNKKKQAVLDLIEKFSSATAGVLVDYKGITVEQDTQMRKALRDAGVEYTVTKNSISRFACKEVGYDKLNDILAGPTAIALSVNDPIAPAKIIAKYAKDIKTLEIKGGFVDGKVISADEVSDLAKLPSREELIAKALGSFNAPISGFVNVLNGNLRGLVVALNAIAEQKAQ